MSSRAVVLYHAHCNDGFTAAWVAAKYFKQHGVPFELIPCHYGQEPYEPVGDENIYLLDFSYKHDVMRALWDKQRENANRIVILDHHESALLDLSALVNTKPTSDNKILHYEDSTLYLCFNLKDCGATLAWKHFFTAGLPLLLAYIRDRDLWEKQLPETDEFHAYTETLDRDLKTWDLLEVEVETRWKYVTDQGRSALRLKDKIVKKAVEKARPIQLGGWRGLAVNSTTFFSEVAGDLSDQPDIDFGCAYFQREDGRWQYSLRSHKGCRVNDIAKWFGGGGHPAAAGFETAGCLF
jgi:oligoribonuclease NrnB/cAMP/cGMP phosphodiesterase (DHH superfamily)